MAAIRFIVRETALPQGDEVLNMGRIFERGRAVSPITLQRIERDGKQGFLIDTAFGGCEIWPKDDETVSGEAVTATATRFCCFLQRQLDRAAA